MAAVAPNVQHNADRAREEREREREREIAQLRAEQARLEQSIIHIRTEQERVEREFAHLRAEQDRVDREVTQLRAELRTQQGRLEQLRAEPGRVERNRVSVLAFLLCTTFVVLLAVSAQNASGEVGYRNQIAAVWHRLTDRSNKCSSSSAISQPSLGAAGELSWSALLGGSEHDYSNGVGTDKQGNVFVAGYTQSKQFYGVSLSGSQNLILAKWSISGSLLWALPVKGLTDISTFNLAIDGEGNALVAGRTSGGDFDGRTSIGMPRTTDIFVTKFNNNGGKLWTKLVGSLYSEQFGGMAIDSANNIVVTGGTNCVEWSGLEGAGSSDIFLTKLNSQGKLLWVRLLGSSSSDVAQGVAVDCADAVLVAGYTNSDVLEGNRNAGEQDVLVAKYSGDGRLLWVRLLGGEGQDMGEGVAADCAGSVYVVGSTQSKLFDGQLNQPQTNGFLAKYNSEGKLLWTRLVSDWPDCKKSNSPCAGVNIEGKRIAVDFADNVYIHGTTDRILTGSVDNAVGTQAFVAKYDSEGRRVWVQQYSFISSAEMTVDTFGHLFLTGHTSSSNPSDVTFNGVERIGAHDVFLMKII